MRYPREQVFQALYNQLLTANFSFNYTSRRWENWSDVPACNFPSMYMNEGPMGSQIATQQGPYGLTRWQLKCTCWIYFKGDPAPSSIPSTQANNILDAMEAAIANPIPKERQTLGGLVENVFIDGTVLLDEGVADNQRIGVLVIPISIISG